MESYKTVPKRKLNYFNIDENIVSSEKISIELINNDEFENIELFAHAEDTNLKVKKLKSSFEVFLDKNIGSLIWSNRFFYFKWECLRRNFF